MWLLVGSIICIFFNTGHGVITVNPSTNPMYFAVGAPATIACTVQVSSGTVQDSIFAVVLSNVAYPSDPVSCPGASSQNAADIIPTVHLGNVSYSRSYTLPSSITCSYTFPSIQDGSYTCGAFVKGPSVDPVTFNVVTTKPLDGLYINDGIRMITANESDLINVSCVATNSKPGYTMSWIPSISNANTLTSNSTTGIYTNSTTSLTMVASSDLNGQTLTCLASSTIPLLGSRTENVTFNIYYGPTDVEKIYSANGTLECSLNSNPQVTDYTWQVGNHTQSHCSGQRWCSLTHEEFPSGVQITCEGRNPVTQRTAHVTIDLIWSTISTVAAVTGASKPEDQASRVLTDGAIAGIVIGAVAFIVLVIVVPVVVCSKRKSGKGASTDSERTGNRSSTTPSSSAPSSSRPYSFESTSGGGYKSPLAAQPDVVRNSGFSPSAAEPGQSQKAPSTPPPAYPGAMDVIDQKPRSRKPIALYDTAFDDAYPNQTNASYIPSPKY